jgi:hypothetical protein
MIFINEHYISTLGLTICSQPIVQKCQSSWLLQQQFKDPSSQSSFSPSPPIKSSISEPATIHNHSVTQIMNPRIEQQQQFVIPKEALMTVIHFYVDLHPSPCNIIKVIRRVELRH